MTAFSVTLKELEALRAVIRLRTTIDAANSLKSSQSSVSRAIGQLEARYGEALFERRAGRLVPTSLALQIDNHLDLVFDAVTHVENRSWKQDHQETLRIAATPTLAHHFLVPNIIAFNKIHSGIRLSLDVRASHGLWEDLLDGRYDLSITTSVLEHTGLSFHKFHESQAVCVLPRSHELGKKEKVSVNDLHNLDFIALPKRLGVRIILDRIMAKHGVEPNIVLETSTGEAACAFVKAGMGAAVINPFPFVSRVAAQNDGIVMKPFEPTISYSAAFVSRGDTPPSGAMRKFMKFVSNRT